MKIKKHSSMIIVLSIIITISLSYFFSGFLFNDSKELNETYKLAGENKKELEKVITHYNPETLERRAAEYLISNLPGHFFYENSRAPQFQALLRSSNLCAKEVIEKRKEIIKATWDSIQGVQGFYLCDFDRELVSSQKLADGTGKGHSSLLGAGTNCSC